MAKKKAKKAANNAKAVAETAETEKVDEYQSPSLAAAMADASKILKQHNAGDFRMVSEAREFRKALIYTGLVEVDLIHRLSFGSKIQVVGQQHAGKSLLTYIVMGAAHRTCRQCQTPIIDFYDDWADGDDYVTTTCMCGKNDPMRVLLFDYEMCYDPAWASVWGVGDGTSVGDMSEIMDGVHISPDASIVVARATSAEYGQVIAEHLMREDVADFIAIDSLAAMLPASRLEGKKMIGDVSKAQTDFITTILSAQADAFAKGRKVPTLWATNQLRVNIGGRSARPGMVPTKVAGAMGMQYGATVTLDVKTKYNENVTDGFKVEHKFGNTVVSSRKDKDTGGTGKQATYRTFVANHTMNRVDYRPGDTNEGIMLFALIKEIALNDPRWYEKKSASKHILFGREFKTAQEVSAFCSRPDIGYQVRYLIAAQQFPLSVRMHLPGERFLYNPYKHDPLMELLNEAAKQTGRNVEPRKREFRPVMQGKEIPRSAGGETPGTETDVTQQLFANPEPTEGS